MAIVTGTRRAIGEEIAGSFARRGAGVAVNDFFAEKAQMVAEEMKAAGGEAMGIKADVTDWDEVVKMLDESWQSGGQLRSTGYGLRRRGRD